MPTFLGFSIHKKLTDSEFVEKQRRNIVNSRRFAWVHIIVVAAFCILIPKLYSFFWDVIKRQPDPAQQLAWSGFFLGLVFGFLIISYLAKAVESIMVGFNLSDINRSTQLLIKYHDALMQAAKERP